MEAHTFTTIFLILIANTCLLYIANSQTVSTASSSPPQSQKNFIKTACNSTTDPQYCYKSLSPLASKIQSNPKKLCIYALTQALGATKKSSSTVKKLKKTKGITHMDAEIIDDCLDNIKDSISALQQSLSAMKALNGTDTESHLGDIKTWVSAAITDDDTCTYGFDDEEQTGTQTSSSATLKKQIKKNISAVAKSTSNALALINNLGPTY